MPKARAKDKLLKLAKTAEKPIFSANAVFPFDLFPDSIRIDREKVTIIYRHIFSSYEFPILIENINGAKVFRGILLASLEIEISGYEKNPKPIKNLFIIDAANAKNYIMGLVHAKREKIDLSKIKQSDLLLRLKTIGEGY